MLGAPLDENHVSELLQIYNNVATDTYFRRIM
jgi:hypothetical protein